ncbi:MAG: ATP-dependent helicase, partial [Planctomycetota bacterium]|nr:ATP-dependent helicase [Planctomycetota bacterium]
VVQRFGDLVGVPAITRIMDSAEARRLMRDIIRANDLFTHRAPAGRDSVIPEALSIVARLRNEAITPGDARAWASEEQQRLDSNEGNLDELALEAASVKLEHNRHLIDLADRFEAARLEQGLLSLDDYINLPIRILRESRAAAAILRDEVRHIIVDEFQDWNPAQIALLKELAPTRTPSGRAPDIAVVGDDDQSIYAFRGADDRAFEHFAAHWSDSTTIPLTINYRSAPPIIATAADIIARAGARFAPDKEIAANPKRDALPGETVEGVLVDHDDHTGVAIAAMILEDRKANPDRRWSDYAVIARRHGTLDTIAAELEYHDIPLARPRKITPLNDQSVRDLLAWIRVLSDPFDGPSAQQLILRPPFAADAAFLAELVRKHRRAHSEHPDEPETAFVEWLPANLSEDDERAKPIRAFLELFDELRAEAPTTTADQTAAEIIRRADLVESEALGGRERADRVASLVQALRFIRETVPRLDPPGDLAAFRAYYDELDPREQEFAFEGAAVIDRDADSLESESPNAVQLLSAHQSKGLEFDTVFIPQCRPGWGYPLTQGGNRDDSEPLPESLTGRPQ